MASSWQLLSFKGIVITKLGLFFSCCFAIPRISAISTFSVVSTLFTVNSHHAWLNLKFERSFVIYMSVLNIANKISVWGPVLVKIKQFLFWYCNTFYGRILVRHDVNWLLVIFLMFPQLSTFFYQSARWCDINRGHYWVDIQSYFGTFPGKKKKIFSWIFFFLPAA